MESIKGHLERLEELNKWRSSLYSVLNPCLVTPIPTMRSHQSELRVVPVVVEYGLECHFNVTDFQRRQYSILRTPNSASSIGVSLVRSLSMMLSTRSSAINFLLAPGSFGLRNLDFVITICHQMKQNTYNMVGTDGIFPLVPKGSAGGCLC